MPIPVVMPKQGQSVESCIITKWHKKTGEKVALNDILFSYETDKAAFELESTSEGTLLEIFFSDGAEVPVLTNVAVIGNPGDNISEFKPGKQSAIAPEPARGSGEAIIPTAVPEVLNPEKTEAEIFLTGSSIRISPRARNLATKKGISIKGISGTGPNGRILFRDIESAMTGSQTNQVHASSPEAEFTDQPVSNIRKIIAKAMHSSLQNSAQLTHHLSADVRKLLEARKKIKSELAAGRGKIDITLNDMVCWCVIRALEKFPEINSHFFGESTRNFHQVHLGIAVDTPRGLMVPAIKNAGKMDIRTLSSELRSAAEACRKGSINPELIQSTSATFTVSNLGNYGVEMFTPVINLPQCGILGVCTIINRPADLGNNILGFVPYMGLSLTYDHRAVDGGPATMFLREIKEEIEKFSL